MPEKLKILVVGQTPPPYGGQAIMIDQILKGNYDKIILYHVRMCFSKEMNEKGAFNFYKIIHIFQIIFKIYYLKFKHNINVIYYPPSNAPKTSIYRDLIILLPTRFLFKKTIFHFHAAGLSEEFSKLNFIEKFVAKLAYNKPDLSISNSRFNPDDGSFFKTKINTFLPYGILDNYRADTKKIVFKTGGTLNVLFIGILNSTKGEGYLLEAVAKLVKKGYDIKYRFAGVFEKEDYREQFFERIQDLNIEKNVEYLEVITGEAKNKAFLQADVFCFPSFFISESLGVVLLEAMQYKLPIISTKWRGIQSIVDDGQNGYLVDIKDAQAIADKLEYYINNPDVIEKFGETGRKLFLEKYHLPVYLKNIEKEFLRLANFD